MREREILYKNGLEKRLLSHKKPIFRKQAHLESKPIKEPYMVFETRPVYSPDLMQYDCQRAKSRDCSKCSPDNTQKWPTFGPTDVWLYVGTV